LPGLAGQTLEKGQVLQRTLFIKMGDKTLHPAAGLGNSSLETTRKIYASSPNMSPIADAIKQTSKKKRQDF
jgi:hypothetical protein